MKPYETFCRRQCLAFGSAEHAKYVKILLQSIVEENFEQNDASVTETDNDRYM